MPLPSNPAIDGFNRVNENPLSFNGKWSAGGLNAPTVGLQLLTNAVQRAAPGGAFGRNGSLYSLVLPAGASCETGATVSTMSVGGAGGTGSELNITLYSSAGNGYQVIINDAIWDSTVRTQLVKRVASVTTILSQENTSVPANGDIYCLQIEGNDIVALRNRAGVWTEIHRATDTDLRTTFTAGLEIAGLTETTSMVVDNFFVGRTAVATLPPPLNFILRRRLLGKPVFASIPASSVSFSAWVQALADTITLSDAITKAVVGEKSDTITLTDAHVKAVTAPKEDTITLSDAVVKSPTSQPADTITLSDAIAKSVGAPKADTISLSELLSRTVVYSRAPADTITLSDAIIKAIGKPQTDSITLSDAIVKSPKSFQVDTITLSDATAKSFNLSKSDSITLSDAIIKAFGANKADTITLSDLLTKAIGKMESDTISLSDAITTTLNPSSGVNYQLSLADTITLTEVIAKSAKLGRSDIITLSDDIAKAVNGRYIFPTSSGGAARKIFLGRFGIY